MATPNDSATERRQRQAAANQSIFRAVNESLKKLNEEQKDVIPIGDFVCECADTNCTARIGMTLDEYRLLRSVPTHFAVRKDHVDLEVEVVIEENPGYSVVEKIGAAAEYAEAFAKDPTGPVPARRTRS